ncbi:putative L-PSP endoribonuclease family protein-like protein [Seiridium unicorne]|uniref:L-PSP endoribonuclease family protein-like protein n=1 Tax=Seiridium unicorne TaxID=138068 RepID=A0ABR2USV2_9PEZI
MLMRANPSFIRGAAHGFTFPSSQNAIYDSNHIHREELCASFATAIGHYSQAFAANGQVWVAGQVAADSEGSLVKGSVTEQAHQICKNTSEILKAANSSLEKVVKVTVRNGSSIAFHPLKSHRRQSSGNPYAAYTNSKSARTAPKNFNGSVKAAA